MEDEAFYQLVQEVVDRLKEQHNVIHDKWVSPERAMEMLNIKSKTTLQKLRDIGAIIYTQPQKRIILYDYDSLIEYLDTNAKNTF